MDYLRKFYTLSRIFTLRNRRIYSSQQRRKIEKLEFSMEACCYIRSKKPERYKSNLPVFNVFKCEVNSGAARCFSSDPVNLSRYMISTFEVYNTPNPVLDVIKISIQAFSIKLFTDRSFVMREFVESAEEAVKVVSKLVSEKKLSELEGLVTVECSAKLKENIDNWVAFDREDIAITDNDFVSVVPYNCEVKEEENLTALQISVFVLVMKNFKSKLETGKEGDFQVLAAALKHAEKEKKIYGANYRFIKWLGKDGSGDWVINGVNHFKMLGPP